MSKQKRTMATKAEKPNPYGDGPLGKRHAEIQAMQEPERNVALNGMVRALEPLAYPIAATRAVHAFPAAGAQDFETTRVALSAALKATGPDQRKRLKNMLLAQAMGMDSLWGNMMGRAGNCETAEGMEFYLSFALRAQAHSRQAVEAWSELDCPRVTYAKNMNLGNQQINVNHAPAESEGATNKLLEITHERVDTGASIETARGDSPLAAVVQSDRTANAGGKAGGQPERSKARRKVGGSSRDAKNDGRVVRRTARGPKLPR